MYSSQLNYNFFLLNKFYKKFFRYSNLLIVSSYGSGIPTRFLNIFKKKLKLIIYTLSLYINFIILFLKMYAVSFMLLV
jgi:hypothetical protein